MEHLNIDNVKTAIEGTVIEIASFANNIGSVRMTISNDFVDDRLIPIYTVVRKMQYIGALVGPDVFTHSFNDDELMEAIDYFNQGQDRLGG